MPRTESKILILHQDAAWRSRLAAMLADMGLVCINGTPACGDDRRWYDLVSVLERQGAAAAAGAIATVVLQAAPQQWREPTPRRHGSSQRRCGSSQLESIAEIITRVRNRLPNSTIVALAPHGHASAIREAFCGGAWDCLEEPVSEIELVRCINEAVAGSVRHGTAQVDGVPATSGVVLRTRSVGRASIGHRTLLGSDNALLEAFADLHDLSVANASHLVARTRQQLRRTCTESTQALVAAADAKDPYMRNHSVTVAAYAEAIGTRMRLNGSQSELLRAAALLHDVGKIAVPDAILTKPGPLTSDEFAVVKRHPEQALGILGHVSYLANERPLILHHHERYDGEGYPGGLAKDRIPIGARVLGVADALDAMFSARSYKPAYDIDRVRKELIAGAGRQFDPDVAEVTLGLLDETHDLVRIGVGRTG